MNRGSEKNRMWSSARKKAGIVCALFFISAILSFLLLRQKETPAVTTVFTEATLPMLWVWDEPTGMRINEMHGYISEMDVLSMRETVTPVGTTNKVSFELDLYKNEITSISYEIYSQEGYRVVASGEATNVVSDNKESDADRAGTTFDIPVGTGLGDGEFALRVIVQTPEQKCISYYTTLVRGELPDYKSQLMFVETFHKNTFLTSSVSELEQYLQSGTQSTHYGKITISDSVSRLMWGNLAPGQIGKTRVSIVDFSEGKIGSYRLEYTVETEDGGVKTFYDAQEVFCVSGNGTTVLSYERTMEEQFVPNANTLSTTRVNLGVQPQAEAEAMDSANGYQLAFVNHGELWKLSISDYVATQIFAFPEAEGHNYTHNHDIKIISVENTGNIKFLVYGYMSAGTHEGEVGIALYSYDAKQNVTMEEIFVPYDKSFEYLQEVMGKIAYINAEGSFYLMVEDSLYYMDFIGTESIQMVEGLVSGSYVIQDGGDVIAWNEDSAVYGAEKIRILKLESGQDLQFVAEKGKLIRSVGFIGEDFVYSVANAQDITLDAYGNTVFPAETIVIVDAEGAEKKRITKDGYYFTEISVTDNMISYEYSEKQTSGEVISYTVIGEEQTVGQATSAAGGLAIRYVSDNKKDRILTVSYNRTIPAKAELKSNVSTICNKQDNERTISSVLHGEIYYYAYGGGKLLGMYERAADAVGAASDVYGYVIDSEGTVIYRRGERQYYMYLLDATVEDGKEILAAYQNGEALDLTGANLEIALQYVGFRKPVLAYTADGWAMIVDYDSSVIGIRYLDTKRKVTVTREKAASMFADGGNVFVVKASS
ncbi:MAG: hypothetical protein E7269_00470 [Lachnospiraceae bacterium]|nr:hypothetical protein [Lachnospiraceae bacterium]